MFQAKMPNKVWGEVVMLVAAIINVLPSKLLGWKCPMVVFIGAKPDYTRFHVFGSLCFHRILTTTKKFEPRAHRGVFLGISTGKKGYKVLDLETKKYNYEQGSDV